jgi:hypothetical protein
MSEKFYNRFGATLVLLLVFGLTAVSAQTPQQIILTASAAPAAETVSAPAAAPAGPAPGAEPPVIEKEKTSSQKFFQRWLDVQTATISTEYRWMQNGNHVQTNNQILQKDCYIGRFRLDAGGNYTVGMNVATGTSFTGSWNTTGTGTGSLITNRYLKQLYLSAKPAKGVELEYGGLGIAKGMATEITTYDNDGYIDGQRLTLKQPEKLFFDELSATYAYLGDVKTPNVFHRFHRLGSANYHQFLAAKRIGRYVKASGDYTFQSGIETLHQAVYVKPAGFAKVDGIRFENYERVDVRPDYGFAVSVEKNVSEKLNVTLGYADIDWNYGNLNANRFYAGKRAFLVANYSLTPEIGFQVFGAQAVKNSVPTTNQTYLVYMMNYNLLKTMKRVRVLP